MNEDLPEEALFARCGEGTAIDAPITRRLTSSAIAPPAQEDGFATRLFASTYTQITQRKV